MRLLTITVLITLVALFCQMPSSNSHHLHAWKYTTDLGGGGYQEVRTCVAIAPATLFALIALGAIIAVLIKTEGHQHHTHSHVHTH